MRCRCGRKLIRLRSEETTYAAVDPDRQTVGASPARGDIGGWQFIPQTPLEDGAPFEFRLGSFDVGQNECAVIHNLKEGLTIAQAEAVVESDGPQEQDDQWVYIHERDVVTPSWHLSDGWVSWHLVSLQGTPQVKGPSANIVAPGVSGNGYLGSPARLVRTLGDEPLDKGTHPGVGVGAFGTMRSLDFPWQPASFAQMHEVVEGPKTVMLVAYVRQSDPTTRPRRPGSFSVATDTEKLVAALGQVPEEQFLISEPDAVYRHIAGAIRYTVYRYHCGGCRSCGCGHERPAISAAIAASAP